VILRALIVSLRDLRPELKKTVIGRQGIEVFRVDKFANAKLVGSSLGVQVILVDREFPDAAGFIKQLRKDPATRDRSIAVLAWSARPDADLEVLNAGANAVLRMPPSATWDERFSKLLTVPVRQQARLLVQIEVTGDVEHPAAILNLSPGGMLVATPRTLRVGDEMGFRFTLPNTRTVIGRGRVARDARPAGFGVEFMTLNDDGKDAVLAHLRSARLE
jgi:CheY-like chemotaxis protein